MSWIRPEPQIEYRPYPCFPDEPPIPVVDDPHPPTYLPVPFDEVMMCHVDGTPINNSEDDSMMPFEAGDWYCWSGRQAEEDESTREIQDANAIAWRDAYRALAKCVNRSKQEQTP